MPANPYDAPGMSTPTLSPSARTAAAGATKAEQSLPLDIAAQRQQLLNLRQQYDRTANTPLPAGPKSAQERGQDALQVAEAQQIGTAAGKAAAALPQVVATAQGALKNLGELVHHPGMPASVGMPIPARGGLGFMTIPGSPAAGFKERLSQSKSGAFLQAIQALRGSGAISEKEGDAATKALNRMSTFTSENEFRAAAQDYADFIAKGVRTTQQMADLSKPRYTAEQLRAEQARRAAQGAPR
jgi:hypothetical protein